MLLSHIINRNIKRNFLLGFICIQQPTSGYEIYATSVIRQKYNSTFSGAFDTRNHYSLISWEFTSIWGRYATFSPITFYSQHALYSPSPSNTATTNVTVDVVAASITYIVIIASISYVNVTTFSIVILGAREIGAAANVADIVVITAVDTTVIAIWNQFYHCNRYTSSTLGGIHRVRFVPKPSSKYGQ